MAAFLPFLAASFLNLIQSNALSRVVRESLGVNAAFMNDADPEPLPMGVGGAMTFATLGRMEADGRPAPPLGATPRGSYSTETYTAVPEPYANTIDITGPQLYTQTAGNPLLQGISRLGDWASRTTSRVARKRVFLHAGGQSIVRRAQTTSDNTLLVTSLAGFRFAYVNGNPVPVSSVNVLPITIKAAGDVFANVTGVTPLDPDFPDGPGQLTLATTLSGNVAAQSYVFATNARPKVVRPNNRVSSEALTATDLPTLADVITMKARLRSRGVVPHPKTNTYHLHVDEWFFAFITQDANWRQSFQGQGVSPVIMANAVWSPTLGITIIENNDSPALGKGTVVQVGASGFTVGATGTPGSSQTMLENGLDVVNSTGISIRYAVMTGAEVMKKVYVDESKYIELQTQMGAMQGQVIHTITNEWRGVNLNGVNFLEGQVENWRLLWRPPMDERALLSTLTVSSTFDVALPTDRDAQSDTVDKSPLKRAVVMQYGAPPV